MLHLHRGLVTTHHNDLTLLRDVLQGGNPVGLCCSDDVCWELTVLIRSQCEAVGESPPYCECSPHSRTRLLTDKRHVLSDVEDTRHPG